MPGKCATCAEVCPYDVFVVDGRGHLRVGNYNACVGCRICAEFCPEDAIRINPAESEFLVRSPWTFPQVEEIHHKAQSGQYMLRGFGTMGYAPNFDNITVVPSQIASPAPRDKYREECNMEVVIGEDTCENPIRLKYPFIFPAMSFGALSREARMALSIADYGYIMESGKIVLDESAEKLRSNEDVKEFYLGLTDVGARKSYRDVKHYRRRKRWLS